jgi:hypothetical protein
MQSLTSPFNSSRGLVLRVYFPAPQTRNAKHETMRCLQEAKPQDSLHSEVANPSTSTTLRTLKELHTSPQLLCLVRPSDLLHLP